MITFINKRTVYMSQFLIILFSVISISCTVNIPDIKITGEKTALENQILGEYKKIKEDAWMIASERGEYNKNSNNLEIPADKKEIIEAIRNREFNKDDVDEFKILGIIGEKRDGLLEIVNNSEIEESFNEKKKKLLEKILLEENNDRDIIMKRIFNLSFSSGDDSKATLKKEELQKEIKKSFFILNLEESPENTFYRDDKNEWEKK